MTRYYILNETSLMSQVRDEYLIVRVDKQGVGRIWGIYSKKTMTFSSEIGEGRITNAMAQYLNPENHNITDLEGFLATQQSYKIIPLEVLPSAKLNNPVIQARIDSPAPTFLPIT